MKKQRSIKTSQNTIIIYELAALSTRVWAFFVHDASLLISWVLLVKKIGELAEAGLEKTYAIMLIPVFLYDPIMCSITGGQTLGKKAMDLKVIKKNGNKAHFGHFLIRAFVFYLIDLYLGIILVASTKHKQRLGDLIAGTVVVQTQSLTSYRLMFDKVYLLSKEDIRVIGEIIDNIPNPDLVQKTVEKLKAILQVPDTPLDGVPFLRQVLKDYDYHRL